MSLSSFRLSPGYGRQRRYTHDLLRALLIIVPLLVGVQGYLTISTAIESSVFGSPIYSYYACGLTDSWLGSASGQQIIFNTQYMGTVQSYNDVFFPLLSLTTGQLSAMALFGLMGTEVMQQVIAEGALFSMIMFAPLSETAVYGTSFGKYLSEVFWTIPLDGAQSLAILLYLEQLPLFPRNQLLMYSTTYGIGSTARALFQLEMAKLGVSNFQVFSGGNENPIPQIASKPGVVYMFGTYIDITTTAEDPVTSQWLPQLFLDSTLIACNATIATTFYIQKGVSYAYNNYVNGFTLIPPQNVISSAPTPGLDSTEYTVVQEFLRYVRSFPSGCAYNACDNYAFAGWVGAVALTQAIRAYFGNTDSATSTTVWNNLVAAQSSFLVSDLFIGSYGPSTSCSAVAESQGAVCHCNQAGINVFFQRLSMGTDGYVSYVSIPGAYIQYAKGKCVSVFPPGEVESESPEVPYTELFTLYPKERLVGLSPTDNTMMMNLCHASSAVSSVLSNQTLYRHLAPSPYIVYCIPTTMTTLDSSLSSHLTAFVTSAMTGVIPDAMIDSITTPSTLVFDFIPQTTQPRVMQSNLVYLFPTLDQELYVLASYLHGTATSSAVVCGVVSQSKVSSSIVTLLRSSLAVYGITVATNNMVQTGGALGSNIPSACTHTFVIGLGDSDAEGIASYLRSHSSEIVLLSFDDVTKYYSSLQTSVGELSNSMTDRLLFATNLPSWTATPSNPTAAADASAPMSTAEQFLQSVSDSLHTPAALRAFFVAMMYGMLTSTGEGLNPNVQQALYDAVTVFVSGIQFGPFSPYCTSIDGGSSSTCVGNAGAVQISVWSYTRVVAPSTPLKMPASTPSMVYYTPASSALVMDELDVSDISTSFFACVKYVESSAEISSSNSSSSAPSSSSSSSSSTKSSSSYTKSHSKFSISIDDVMMFEVAALIVVVVLLVLLILWKFGVLQALARWCRCFTYCCVTAPSTYDHQSMDDYYQLQKKATDASRCEPCDGDSKTVVFVELEYWRALWVHAPEVMRHAVHHYQRCVREAVIRHRCVEVRCVSGICVIVCSSAIDSLQLVMDIHRGLNCMSSALKDSLSSSYASLGVPRDERYSGVFNVRIGVDTSGDGGSSMGPGECSQALVEVATRTAYRNRSGVGFCLMTERTRTALPEEQLVSTNQILQSTGFHSIHCGANDLVLELFVLLPSDNTSQVTLSTSIANEQHCEYALEMLSSGVEVYVGVSSVLCGSTLVAFYTGLSKHRVERLEGLLQWFRLPAVSRSAFADESTYVDALLSSVSIRLAALLECRHGILPGQLRSRGQGVGAGAATSVKPREGSGEGEEGHHYSEEMEHTAHRRPRTRLNRRASIVLRRFAYSSANDSSEDGDVHQSHLL